MKLRKLLAILIAAVMAVTMMTGIAFAEEEKEAVDTEAFIGISVPKAVTGWTAAISFYAQKYVDELGLNAKIVQADSTNEQANQIDELIAQNPAAIVLLPINDELATAGKTVMDAGITLVNVDRTLGETEPDYYYGGDNPGCGAKGADWLVETLGDEFTVAVCSVTSWGGIAEQRRTAFEERLAEIAPKAVIVNEYASESASQEDGLALGTDVLQANPQLDAIFCVDDEQGAGVLQAISENGRDDIKALYAAGGGATVFLNKIPNSPFPIATVSYYPTIIQGGIQQALDYVAGKDPEKEIIEEAVVIDAKNAEEWKESVGYDPAAPY